MRIQNHPILGDQASRKKVTIDYKGKKIKAYEGEPIAAGLSVAETLGYLDPEKSKILRREGRSVTLGARTEAYQE